MTLLYFSVMIQIMVVLVDVYVKKPFGCRE